MLKLIVLFCCIGFSVAKAELSLVQSIRINSSEISKTPNFSGLTTDGKDLFTVSDRDGLHSIYKLDLSQNNQTIIAEKYLNFPKQFLNSYSDSTKAFGRIDLEGICFTKDKFYLINETLRDVLSLDRLGKADLIRIPFKEFHKGRIAPFSGMRNAGLEAIACDDQNKQLYLFNERQFRMAYQYDLKTELIHKQFTFPSGNDLPRSLNSQGSKWMYPDFAGSHYVDGVLYILVRNRRMIVKYDPIEMKVLVRKTYKKHEDALYDSPEEFGLAEGLTILEDQIYIIFDNNSFPLRGTKSDTSSSLLVFKRF
ncbi:MAG: esterase-like activity of phytase family protein [Candidatus Cloacimonetes bacterium]|nr:esterase-like activity of phytase family protein [Candidatus Cloacimonadota bacterium]